MVPQRGIGVTVIGKVFLMNNFMNYEYLVETESSCLELTREKHPTWFKIYPLVINSFYEVSYFAGKEDDIESIEGAFLTFTHNHLLKVPYTIRAVSILGETGYYLESTLLVRNLLEILVQLRYFQKNKDKLNDHVLKVKKVRLRTMFDEFNPNLYKTVYFVLSEVAHGGFGASVFMTKYSSPQEGKVIMDCDYNEMFFNFILNQMIPIVFGMLNFVPLFFP